MKIIQRLFAWTVTALLLASISGPLATEAHAATKPAALPKPQQINATVVSCDEKTLTVRTRKGEELKLTINIESQFGPKGTLKGPVDFKAGNHVHVTFVKDHGERVLKQVVHVVKHIN